MNMATHQQMQKAIAYAAMGEKSLAATGECAEHGDVSSWRDALIFWIGALSGLIGWALVIAVTWLLAPSMMGFGEAFVRVFGGVR